MLGLGGKLYYYVLAKDAQGASVLNGPFDSERDAREDSGDLEDVTVYKLKTRDRQAASRKIKSLKLKETGSHEKAMERHTHRESPMQASGKRSFFEPEGEDIRNA